MAHDITEGWFPTAPMNGFRETYGSYVNLPRRPSSARTITTGRARTRLENSRPGAGTLLLDVYIICSFLTSRGTFGMLRPRSENRSSGFSYLGSRRVAQESSVFRQKPSKTLGFSPELGNVRPFWSIAGSSERRCHITLQDTGRAFVELCLVVCTS